MCFNREHLEEPLPSLAFPDTPGELVDDLVVRLL